MLSSSSLLASRRPVASTSCIAAPMFVTSLPDIEPLTENGIVYKVADCRQELTGAFRLVHDAYVETGLMRPNVFQMRIMPHHLLPTSAVLVAKLDDQVVSTMTVVGDGRLGLPMEKVYDREVDDLRQPSSWLAEVSALASAPHIPQAGREAVIRLMQMASRFSRRNGIDHLLVAVHPRHGRFYRRAMGFRILGEERSYPAVQNRPAVALDLNLSTVEAERPNCVPMLFGNPIAEDHLRFCPISAEERRFFASVVAYQENVTDTAPTGEVLACA